MKFKLTKKTKIWIIILMYIVFMIHTVVRRKTLEEIIVTSIIYTVFVAAVLIREIRMKE